MKTLAVISQKGGSGKTTIAVHMAVCAARRNVKTALIDIDPQRL
jgi:chromosome partitioning protein